MLTLLLFSFSSLIFSQYHPQEWGSITSLLTPNGIQTTTDGIVYASTSGGLLQFNPNTEKFTFIKMQDGLIYLDLSCIEIDKNGRLWLGGTYPNGYLQVYDPIRGLVRKITHLDITQINMIRIGENIAFAAYEGVTSSDIGILAFKLDKDGLPDYQDYYTNFSDETITEIRDLELFQGAIYLTTDRGVYSGNYKEGSLKNSQNWMRVSNSDSSKQYLPEVGLIVNNGVIIEEVDNVEYYSGLNGEVIQANSEENGKINILTQDWYYELNNNDLTFAFEMPEISHTKTKFTSFRKIDNNHLYFGLENAGLLSLNQETGNYHISIPNTPFRNTYHALTVTQKGYLAAISNIGTLVWQGITYQNFIPWQHSIYTPDWRDDPDRNKFIWTHLNYLAGEQIPLSIVEKENGNLIFPNNGIIPDQDQNLETPAVIEFDFQSTKIKYFGRNDENIDGLWDIYIEDNFSEYMVVNQIQKDNNGNIWITNPYCEINGNLLAIQMADDDVTWSHVHIPDSNSFRPQTVAFDQSNRVWIGFAYDALENTIYSNGGIKILEYTNLNFSAIDDSSWLTISNPDAMPGGSQDASVWSIAFDKMNHLWILNEKGIRSYEGYSYNRLNKTITLNPFEVTDQDGNKIPYDFLSHISYAKGNRIRVDSQNNKWVITHQGVWVILESMTYWPSANGLNTENSGLLSDIVYDIAFDDDKGLAYLATDKGISILQIPFSDNPTKKQSMYISPNPFIMPDDERVIIKNVPSGSIIKIMTITGNLIKEIQLPPNESQATWDGTDEQGKQVGTAVYLVATHHSSERNKVSKIAVIRK